MTQGRASLRGLSWAALGAALAWSVLLVVGALTLPVYTGVTVVADGTPPTTSMTSATLVAENGRGVLVVIAVPLVVTLLVGLSLALVPWPAGRAIAWVLTAGLAVLNALAMLTIGIFVLPVTIALAVACAKAGRSPHPAAAS